VVIKITNFSYKYNDDLTFYFSSPQDVIYFQSKISNENVISNLKKGYENQYGLRITTEMCVLLIYARMSKKFFNVDCCGVILWRQDVERMLALQPKLINKLKDTTQKSKE
jgi:hypothetical protein